MTPNDTDLNDNHNNGTHHNDTRHNGTDNNVACHIDTRHNATGHYCTNDICYNATSHYGIVCNAIGDRGTGHFGSRHETSINDTRHREMVLVIVAIDARHYDIRHYDTHQNDTKPTYVICSAECHNVEDVLENVAVFELQSICRIDCKLSIK
jgi:hypothetical protein